jgi:murein DD-endopeptidase MepM/ murein hydrolase activator NlpD
LRELEPEIYPDRRIRLILDNMGSRHSITIHVWMLGVIFVLVLGGIIALGIFAFRSNPAEASPAEKKLRQENRILREKLNSYEEDLDSLKVKVEALKSNDSPGETAYPYFGGDAKSSENSALSPVLAEQLDTIEFTLAALKSQLGLNNKEKQRDFTLPEGFVTHGDGIPSIYPTFGEFTSAWGMRMHPLLDELAFHTGVDIANRVGTPVYATADGIVGTAHTENGFGKVIVINHVEGYQTMYGHLYGFKVKPGEAVHKGQIIGLMGNTGMSTGPHLHYCVIHNGASLDPQGYLNRIDNSSLAQG